MAFNKWIFARAKMALSLMKITGKNRQQLFVTVNGRDIIDK